MLTLKIQNSIKVFEEILKAEFFEDVYLYNKILTKSKQKLAKFKLNIQLSTISLNMCK